MSLYDETPETSLSPYIHTDRQTDRHTHTHTLREAHVKTQQEGEHLQARKRILTRNTIARTLIVNFWPPSPKLRKLIFVV